ncbi:MAG: hypothetical protein AB8B55_24150 [Mariniblastus sp.]
MNAPQTFEQVLEYYQQKLELEEATAKRCAARWSGVGILRGILFLGCIAPFLMGFATAWGMQTIWFVLAGVLFAGFVAVAFFHEGLQKDLRRSSLLAKMHRESLARCNRQWTKITVPKIEVPPKFAPTSKDLDLLGDSSVYKLLGTTRTPLGTETLRSWIIEGALVDEVKLRQDAVAELRDQFDWRLKFRLSCEQLSSSQSGPSKFVEWSESPTWFTPGRIWILWLARATGIGSILAIVLFVFGVVPLTVAGPALMLTAAINFGLSVFYAGSMHDVFNQVSSRTDEAIHYVSLFDMVSEFPAKSEKLKQLQTRLQRTADGAQVNVQKLGGLIFLANLRRKGFFFIVYMIFEFLCFWDAHALHLLEKWKAKNGHRAKDWFVDLGEWEAICALAKLAGDEPEWIFPRVSPASQNDAVIEGKQIGHPLLDRGRVPNDVQIGPPGTVLLVTGSNMSGKSTLLRSVGVNAVLAQMGSVVCAETMSLPPIHIETSMRIADSLADGVSFFMAELKRLKEIVDTAKAHDDSNPRRMMFLLDEILQGTNSRERQIAVSRVVRRLIDGNAIGAISTHDLDLAKTDDLEKACQTVHFSEQFTEVDGKKQMTFDYQMKSGIAETTNALKLLEIVGLGEE